MADRSVLRAWALAHLALFALAAAVFSLWPEIDLAAARFFFRDGAWIGSGQPGIEGFRRLASVLVFGLPAAAVALWLLGRLLGRPAGGRAALVLVLSLALGPGLLVNGVLKEHWGRARPSQIVEFGRDRAFTPALTPTNQCERNCSFASGEVAMAFGLAVVALLVPRRRWLAAAPGLVLGTAMAVARMAAGGHFLSDVIFAGLIATGTGLLVYVAVYRPQAARA
jgi:lipid A 4'-phosphatase